jgi:hypothetical protein
MLHTICLIWSSGMSNSWCSDFLAEILLKSWVNVGYLHMKIVQNHKVIFIAYCTVNTLSF